MFNETDKNDQNRKPSYGEALSKLSGSAMDLIKSEVALMRAEVKQVGKKLSRDATMAAIFGGVTIVSVFPFLAFAVIGLGLLLDGRYWLSSLIVSVVCAVVGGIGAYMAIKKLKMDTDLPHTRKALNQDTKAVAAKMGALKNARKGESNEREQDRFH